MKVNVVIPLYNKAPFIREMLESVLSQTYADFRVIIIDDCSTDGGQEIVKSFTDPRIRFYQNEKNLGPAGNANRCLDLADSEYIIRHDADDIMLPKRIQLQVEFMDAHPEIHASSGELVTFGGGEVEHWKPATDHDELFAKILFQVPVIQGAAILRNQFVKEHGLKYMNPGPTIGEDWLFWFNMAMKGGRFSNLKEVLIKYRKNANNITEYTDHGFYPNRRLMYLEFFKSLGLPEEFVDIHFLTKPYFVSGSDCSCIEKFKNWCNYLKQWNSQNQIFSEMIFNRQLEDKWNRLFYYLPERGQDYVKMYKKYNGGLSTAQRTYNFKYRIKHLLSKEKGK